MRRFLLCCACFAVAGSPAWAEETVTVRNQETPIKGVITQESGAGVTIKIGKGTKTLPADDIIDVVHEDVEPIKARLALRQARAAEKESSDPAGKEAKRKEKLAEALKIYQANLPVLNVDQKSAKCHVEYKIAVLSARQAQEAAGFVDDAIAKLTVFKTKFPNSWQLGGSLKLLAELQLDKKQYKEAEDTYKELAEANVGEETKQEAELLAALVTVRTGKHELAQKRLRALIARLPKDSKQAGRARVAEAECLIAANKHGEATKLLRQIVKETNDKTMKAAAYNALGASLFAAGQYKEARWEFLWVDVVYNQDRNEHAKALYYLWKTFSQLGEMERAQECLESLLSDRQFTGTEYQHKAKLDSAKAS
jgi:TolA-binding protein